MKSKKSFYLLLVLLIVTAFAYPAQAQQNNMLTSVEKDQGWKLLFNGHDLSGWHSYLKDQPGEAWKVENGIIALDPQSNKGRGDLTTDEEYKNFDLKLEWKISPEGNSGIIFNVHESPKYQATYSTGPEMQVLDNKNAEDNKIPSHLAGSLYDMIAAPANAVNPANQWNKVRIKEDNGQLTFWLNGKQVVDIKMGGGRWKQLLRDSKFSDWKGFAEYDSGHIALQDHGHAVWFRNIKIKRL